MHDDKAASLRAWPVSAAIRRYGRTAEQKAQALFAYLALSAGRSHRRDKLAGLLWSDRGDADARHSLRQALSLITKAMRSGPWGATAMSIEADAIAIEPAAIEVDAARLEGLVADGSPEALLEAVGLWHGDLLDGLNLQAQPFEEWLLGQRARYHELAVEAHRLLLEHQMRCEGREPAIMTALRLLALDAANEETHRKLMRLYLARGRKDAALRQFQICADALKREFDLQPDAETRALHRAIIQGRTAANSIQAQESGAHLQPPMSVDALRAGPPAVPPPAIAVLPFVNRERRS